MTSKVRIACRRCRMKRIKCDGSIPACSNCQKANEVCLDVDGRNNSISIPRDFTANARARIDWLEEQLRHHTPHVNLDDGPKVDFRLQQVASLPATLEAKSVEAEDAASLSKRTFDVTQEQTPPQEQPFTAEARSVALDLGLLSLGSDSRQLHYLGSSSGRLFTSLIGLGLPDTTTQTSASSTPSSLSQSSPYGKPGPFAYAKRQKEASRLVYDILRKTLPAREDAQILLETYFRHIHAEHPFLHPGSIVAAIEALYQCAAAEPSAEIGFNGWVTAVEPFAYNGEFALSRGVNCTSISIFTATFHVFMVFTLAATVRTRQRMYDFAPDQFYRAATSVAHYCFSDASVATLQAILLLAVHSLLSPTEMNIWTLTYTAMAQCIDLGLHRMPADDNGASDAAALTRKMVFFNVYHLDRSVATIQGRPLGIRDETFDVQLPSLQDVQADAAALTSSSQAPELSIPPIVAFAIHRFRLDPIISEIKLLFYHLPSQISAYSWPADHQATQTVIRQRLQEWRHEISSLLNLLPQDMIDEDHQLDMRRYELTAQSQFFAAMILLYQPSQMIPHPGEEALLICYQCAVSRINIYNSLYNADGLFQSWRGVQGVFSSGATMIYCLWTSSSVQKSVPLSKAMTDLRTCTNLLSVGGGNGGHQSKEAKRRLVEQWTRC
ncbi:uncharacterized protein TrAtP1_002881 [Trichoderma atroviride]|uniref:uncharacterized protein n=1 Tax=Hypocrea atroviridis TaxID=63577 RepID=UPI003330CCC1|nr:hypothetical protein TrAtP1_002881 [Trichoderma atroviride]